MSKIDILVIEDSNTITQMLKNTKHTVFQTSSLDIALSYIKKYSFNLMFIDIKWGGGKLKCYRFCHANT